MTGEQGSGLMANGYGPWSISHQPSAISHFIGAVIVAALCASAGAAAAQNAASLPELTEPVNDFAHVIDPDSRAAMDSLIRELQEKSGDVVVVATVDTIEPFGTPKEYAVKLFENHGRGIGQKGKDNGVLILLAMKERRVEVEVGYDLEQWITDGFSGETSRNDMAPRFLEGRFGEGLLAGTTRIAGRIAQARGVTLTGVRAPVRRTRDVTPIGMSTLFWIFIAFLIISRIGGGRRRRRYWGSRGGWSSGVGPFGGGFGGGFGGFGGGGFGGGGGGFGGGFGGFGGGRSGGGGGGASW